MLRQADGAGYEKLQAAKFIVYEADLKSGLAVRSGLAVQDLYYSLMNSYNVSSWANSVDRFGYPI